MIKALTGEVGNPSSDPFSASQNDDLNDIQLSRECPNEPSYFERSVGRRRMFWREKKEKEMKHFNLGSDF